MIVKDFKINENERQLRYFGSQQVDLSVRNEIAFKRTGIKLALNSIFDLPEITATERFLRIGYVYIVESMGLHKIGKSNDPRRRIIELNQTNCSEINKVGCFKVKNATTTEKMIHKKYKQYKHHGEWFKLTISQVEEIIIFCKSRKFDISENKTAEPYEYEWYLQQEASKKKLA